MKNYGKAEMIHEVETIIPQTLMTDGMFPRSIIIRQVEN